VTVCCSGVDVRDRNPALAGGDPPEQALLRMAVRLASAPTGAEPVPLSTASGQHGEVHEG